MCMYMYMLLLLYECTTLEPVLQKILTRLPPEHASLGPLCAIAPIWLGPHHMPRGAIRRLVRWQTGSSLELLGGVRCPHLRQLLRLLAGGADVFAARTQQSDIEGFGNEDDLKAEPATRSGGC